MPYKNYIVIVFLLFSQFCFSQNLITNGSFEDSVGNPSLDGWFVGYMGGHLYDTSSAQFSANVPPGGGMWSIQISQFLFSAYHLAWYLTEIQGTYIFKLSVWAKKSSPDYYYTYPPSIALGVLDSASYAYSYPEPFPPIQEGVICDSIPINWDNIVLIDTLSIQYTDTIAVILSAGTLHLTGDYAYYDLVDLEITDTLVLTQNTVSVLPSDIKIYPNPFNENTTIKFRNKKHDCIKFILFSTIGQSIWQIETSEEHIYIEKGKLSGEILFYQLINHNNGELLGNGKIVIQ